MQITKVAYSNSLVLRHVGGELWATEQPFTCTWQDDGRPHAIEVPAGFINDLSSIPQAFRSIIPVVGDQNLPSVVHDLMYSRRDRRGRAYADALFLAGLKAMGVGWFRRTSMYYAVRAFGGAEWEDDD